MNSSLFHAFLIIINYKNSQNCFSISASLFGPSYGVAKRIIPSSAFRSPVLPAYYSAAKWEGRQGGTWNILTTYCAFWQEKRRKRELITSFIPCNGKALLFTHVLSKNETSPRFFPVFLPVPRRLGAGPTV